MAKTTPSCLNKSSSSPNLSSIPKSSSSSSLASLKEAAQPCITRSHRGPLSDDVNLQDTPGRQRNTLQEKALPFQQRLTKQTSASDSTKFRACFSRRSILSSATAIAPSFFKKAANYSAQSTAVWFGTSELVWPIDEKTLCEIAETCVKTRTAVGMSRDANMFFVHHLFQNVVSFYENLFNEGIDQDHFVLRLIYQHIVAVIDHIKTLDVCTEDALHNFDKMRKAMETELDLIHTELYQSGKSI